MLSTTSLSHVGDMKVKVHMFSTLAVSGDG